MANEDYTDMTKKLPFDIPEEFREQLQKVRKEQIALATKISLENEINIRSLQKVVGLDVAYKEEEEIACAAVVMIDFHTMEKIEERAEYFKPPIPYIPTFLYTRESPGYHLVLRKLKEKPELLLFDGNGILHPFGLGLASQMGLDLNIPTIGFAKKLLIGEYKEPLKVGGYSEIIFEGKSLGVAMQTVDPPAKPIFVSPGHLINLRSSVRVVQEFIWNQGFPSKQPLPIVLADKLAKKKLGEL